MKKMNGMISGTTVSHRFNDVIDDLMINLLKKSYPIVKVKVNNRFKRGIKINNTKLSFHKDNDMIKYELKMILTLLYSVNDNKINNILKRVYNL